MIVCVCHRVSDSEIASCAEQGMDFDEVQVELGVGTCCGHCTDCAKNIIGQSHTALESVPQAFGFMPAPN